MSVDLYLYCKKTPQKRMIEKVIFPFGFKKERDFVGYYHWFEKKNLVSLRGCWLHWYKHDKVEVVPRGTKTIFIATTYAGRSHEDLNMQNNIIKELRKNFGGSFYDPQEDRYAYLENVIPRLTYPEKRCGLLYVNKKELLKEIEVFPRELEKGLPRDPQFIPFSAIQNNILLPFLVSLLESFLRDFFIAYVESFPDLIEKIYDKQGKLEYTSLRDLMEGKLTLVEYEAGNYSFQNLRGANHAFEGYIGINLFDILAKRKKFGNKFYKVRDVLRELLRFRHRIVHGAFIDRSLGKKRTMRFLKFVEYAMTLLAEHLGQEKGFRIDLEAYL